jgi:RNA polymerase sigma-70 factor (ECF subfamily)
MEIALTNTLTNTLTDAELLSRSQAEDGEAFGQLVDRHKDLVVNYLARLVGCRDRAEDYAQETFVRLYQNLGRYRDEGNLAAYLLRIATNLVRSDERRRRRWQMLRPFLRADGHDPAAGPQRQTLAHEEHRQVARALAEVDLTYRVPLVLREIEGRSYEEIAEVLGVRIGTVKSRLSRGRRQLKEKLQPYWTNGGET